MLIKNLNRAMAEFFVIQFKIQVEINTVVICVVVIKNGLNFKHHFLCLWLNQITNVVFNSCNGCFYIILLLCDQNGPFLASFFLYFCLFNTVDSKQMFNKSVPMTGFEPRISVIGSDRSTTESQPLQRPILSTIYERTGRTKLKFASLES